IARAWRRGQTKAVNVHWVITKGSLEEDILNMCDNKNGMSNEYIYNQTFTKKDVRLTAYRMEQMIAKAIDRLNVKPLPVIVDEEILQQNQWAPPEKITKSKVKNEAPAAAAATAVAPA